jgi:peptide chain release factor 1
VLQKEKDEEMREMAKGEIDELDLKLKVRVRTEGAPYSQDPNDDKNVLLEIRAGTGGDEAAIFAGDLGACTNVFVNAGTKRCRAGCNRRNGRWL